MSLRNGTADTKLGMTHSPSRMDVSLSGLKHQPGGDIGVHGSISAAQALLTADVVDELTLAIAPTIAGRGRRLLDGLPPIRLESIRSEISPTGYLIVDCCVIR
jgi:dihydrofolate reductase